MSNETSNGGGRRVIFLLACDPTILGVEAEGDLWLDQYTPDSVDKLGRQTSQSQCSVQVQRVVAGSQGGKGGSG